MANDLLKEAIADAKAVRETALANAKIALEEAFTPRLQSMLSAKLAEEEGLEDEPELEAEPVAAEPVAAEGRGLKDADEDPTDVHSEEMAPEEDPVAAEGRGNMMDADEDPTDVHSEDLELEAIIRELEEELSDEEAESEPAAPVAEGEDEEAAEPSAPVEEDISIDEIINALREEEGEDDEVKTEADSSEIGSVKLVYATLSESLQLSGRKTKRSIKESYASTPSRSTAPKKRVISEGTDLTARWKKLANL
jgi:hypothetical protein